jgi:hypothetical protein
MNAENSVVLRKFITAALLFGAGAVSESAFASCGEAGRPPCEMDRVSVIGVWNIWDVENPCFGECNWQWDDIPPYNDEGGNPTPTDPEWTIDPDLQCGQGTIPIDPLQGGGTVTLRLCRNNGDWELAQCTDNPEWGPSGCP